LFFSRYAMRDMIERQKISLDKGGIRVYIVCVGDSKTLWRFTRDFCKKQKHEPISLEGGSMERFRILRGGELSVTKVGMLVLLLSLSTAFSQTENVFTRGNVNDDFKVNLADLEYLYTYLNQSGPEPLCMDAADVNDDGLVNNADYLMLQSYLVGGGAEPMAPFPNRGWDPTADLLTCSHPTPAFPPWPGHPHDNITVCCALGSQ
jgi:hypothetical protein